MVAGRWGWDTPFMLANFGWKALVGIALASAGYALFFGSEFRTLAERALRGATAGSDAAAAPVPVWVTLVHVAFLGWTVFAVHTPALVLGAFLFCIAFTQAQRRIRARSSSGPRSWSASSWRGS